MNWHFDHSKGRCLKGISILNMLYRVSEMSIPIGFEIVKKEVEHIDPSTEKSIRKRGQNKNQQMRKLLEQAVNNKVVFKWVIADIWYGGTENMGFIKDKCKRDFIVPLKKNRKVALSETAKNRGHYVPIGSLKLEPGARLRVYLTRIMH